MAKKSARMDSNALNPGGDEKVTNRGFIGGALKLAGVMGGYKALRQVCNRCDDEIPSGGYYVACPHCGSFNWQFI
ncbi:MAG: hypothetical protein HQL06_00995 [Nitrospirae bacterium]|nr:hypothetical protein [Nitrospirota bacterium]